MDTSCFVVVTLDDINPALPHNKEYAIIPIVLGL